MPCEMSVWESIEKVVAEVERLEVSQVTLWQKLRLWWMMKSM